MEEREGEKRIKRNRLLMWTIFLVIVLATAGGLVWASFATLEVLDYSEDPYFTDDRILDFYDRRSAILDERELPDVGQRSGQIGYQKIDIGCLPGLVGSTASFVVGNQEEYDALLIEYYEKTKDRYKELWKVETDEDLQSGLPFKGCEVNLPTVDFDQYTLLSHAASGSGCTTDFNERIEVNEKEKKFIFTIEVVDRGFCGPLRMDRFSVLIPKIPDDYGIDFEVVTSRQPLE